MFDEFNNYQPDYCYSAPAFDTGPAFDPFELTFDAPDVEPASYQPTADDPMAYILPAVVDSFAFDMSSPNAAVGFAMNEIARMQHLSAAQSSAALEHVQTAADVCAAHRMHCQMRHGFPWLPYDDNFMSLPRESRSEYLGAQREYEHLLGFRLD